MYIALDWMEVCLPGSSTMGLATPEWGCKAMYIATIGRDFDISNVSSLETNEGTSFGVVWHRQAKFIEHRFST